MRIVYFCHSLVSDWNHGNAHFLRGVVTDLLARGHEVSVLEPTDGWSRSNLTKLHGTDPIRAFREAYPKLHSTAYDLDELNLEAAIEGADVVIAHEWNEPELIRRLGAYRADNDSFVLLFHDTHHRSATAREEMARFDLSDFDGALVFGEAIAHIYRRHGWARRVWVWHEAADVRKFSPRAPSPQRDVVWIGNWGDEERTAELEEFFIRPVRDLGLAGTAYGVRYPAAAERALCKAGIEYRGWLPNFEVPRVYAEHRLAVHVPRRPYTQVLPGIPTIRVFEALACAMPLLCAPWSDEEGLFGADDYGSVVDGKEMTRELRRSLDYPRQARERGRRGRETILERHTCGHRVVQLLDIVREVHDRQACRIGISRPLAVREEEMA